MKLNFYYLVAFVFFQFSLSAMTTKGDRILDSEGEKIQLHGVNWFGFNNGSTMVDGLWEGSNGIAGDFATIVHRMQLLGFNAVRLPFSFKDLYEKNPRDFTAFCQMPTQEEIQESVTHPSMPNDGTPIPPLAAPPSRTEGRSNDYFPNDTTLNRFLWVVNFFAKNGFYVLIDNHLREDETVLEDQRLWVQQWTDLVIRISEDPVSQKMLMIDILNEPDNYGIRWEPSGNLPGLKELYLSAMESIYQINPEVLFFIEGTGQGDNGANWGDGFATDPGLIAEHGLSDPTSFFEALLEKPYLNQVVISPHVYPPSVTHAADNYTGEGLYKRLSDSFGYLTQQGFGKETCKTFPIALGEFGSRFTDSDDLASLQDIAKYLNNRDDGADGRHRAIHHWFYWCWNPNSGDTGGLVSDNWADIQWDKIDYLFTIGLKPWHQQEKDTPNEGCQKL
jgi:aryl-phospho-beta-D-glucosidase BglC (GH1 family)